MCKDFEVQVLSCSESDVTYSYTILNCDDCYSFVSISFYLPELSKYRFLRCTLRSNLAVVVSRVTTVGELQVGSLSDDFLLLAV